MCNKLYNSIANAESVKAILISYFLNKEASLKGLWGSEVFYGSKKRQADLINIREEIIAFEIKASHDTLNKVRSQLDDYKKVFDYVYLVVTENHLDKALKTVTNKEGVILIDNNQNVHILKSAEKINKQSKIQILDSIPVSFLRRMRNEPSNLNAYLLRKKMLKLRLFEIRNLFRSFLMFKLDKRNISFKEQTGKNIHSEDLQFLSRVSTDFM